MVQDGWMVGWVERRSRRLFQKRVSVCHGGVCASGFTLGDSALIGKPFVVFGVVVLFICCLSWCEEQILSLFCGLRSDAAALMFGESLGLKL